jgi:hypothetical protein
METLDEQPGKEEEERRRKEDVVEMSKRVSAKKKIEGTKIIIISLPGTWYLVSYK